MNNETYSDRLNKAMKDAGFTQGSLAKAVGISQSSVWKLASGAAKGSRKTVEIARVLGVKPEWLASGEGEYRASGSADSQTLQNKLVTKDTYRVDVLEVTASAGPGSFVSSEFIETIKAIEYTEEQARLMFGNRPSHTIKVITVRGDSMEGTIEPGDFIFADIAINHFEGDGIYVFVFGNTMHVKRLQMHKDRILVLSDNTKYKEWYIEDGEMDKFHIMAKVLIKQSAAFKRFS